MQRRCELTRQIIGGRIDVTGVAAFAATLIVALLGLIGADDGASVPISGIWALEAAALLFLLTALREMETFIHRLLAAPTLDAMAERALGPAGLFTMGLLALLAALLSIDVALH